MKRVPAQIFREYGPFPGIDAVHGVSFDGRRVWFASGDRLNALDPDTGQVTAALDVAAPAGTAFDGEHLFQIAEALIRKIDPATGEVLGTIPTPGPGDASGLAWAEGTLWVGQYRGRKIHQIDPETGAVLRTIESDRFVTGVTWVEGELWHGTWQDEASEIRRVDPETGELLDRIDMPDGTGVSGLESDGGDRFFCGGGRSGTVRAIRRPSRSVPSREASAGPSTVRVLESCEVSGKATGSTRLRGSCLCGQVLYEVPDAFEYALYCHCSECRRATGAASKPLAGIAAHCLAIVAGEHRIMRYGDDRGHDAHCERCGSLLYSLVRGGTHVHVTLGTLIDVPSMAPSAHIFVGSKAPWEVIGDDLPRFEGFPPD